MNITIEQPRRNYLAVVLVAIIIIGMIIQERIHPQKIETTVTIPTHQK